MATIDKSMIGNNPDDMPRMELFVIIQSNVSIEIEQIVSKLNLLPTEIWLQKHEFLQKNPDVASSIASYKCYSGYVQDTNTPVLEGLQCFRPHLQQIKRLCESNSGLFVSILLQITVNEVSFSPAFFFEPETLELLNAYKTSFSIQILDTSLE